MATSLIWLPLVAAHQANGNVGEAGEVAGFLLVLSLLPLCLAALTGIAYWTIGIGPEKHPTKIGLG